MQIANYYNIPMALLQICYLTFFIKKSMCFIMRTYNFTWD